MLNRRNWLTSLLSLPFLCLFSGKRKALRKYALSDGITVTLPHDQPELSWKVYEVDGDKVFLAEPSKEWLDA